MFDILHMVHINVDHGGRNRMEHSIKQKYKNIIRDIIVLYLQLCEICNKTRPSQKRFSNKTNYDKSQYTGFPKLGWS